jgi:hypothetical protein
MVRAWHGRGMASVNQTRPHYVNQIRKTHSKHLAARHGHSMLCVNRPLVQLRRLLISAFVAVITTTLRPLCLPENTLAGWAQNGLDVVMERRSSVPAEN